MLYFADSSWLPSDPNPFCETGEYGEHWSAFIYNSTYIYSDNKNFKIRCVFENLKYDPELERAKDFIDYEQLYGRNVIIQIPSALRKRIFEPIKEPRSTDPEWVVHSTTKSAWNSIRKSGKLLSGTKLREKGISFSSSTCFYHDPPDFNDYIMFDDLNGNNEIVIRSKQHHKFLYCPGVRLYFDAKRMIQDKIVVRDGVHILKVKDEVLLSDYLVYSFEKKIQICTPRYFKNKANREFRAFADKHLTVGNDFDTV